MNNDLISRKWLTDAIRNRRTYLSYEDAKDVIDLIDNAPTVEGFTKEDMSGAYNEGYMCGSREAEKARPQGEWIWLGDNPNTEHKWSCNKCGRGVKEPENFCPNCGLKMQKGGTENEN